MTKQKLIFLSEHGLRGQVNKFLQKHKKSHYFELVYFYVHFYEIKILGVPLKRPLFW